MTDPFEVLHETFLGLDPDDCRYDGSQVVLLRVPYDRTASYQGGASAGPRAIMDASTQLEVWDVELGRTPWKVGIHTLPVLSPSAAGPEVMTKHIEASCMQPLTDAKLIFTLGGDHSVTIGAARAVARHHEALTFLQVDAHLDLRENYEDSRFSHACVASRLLELGRVVHVGVRSACEEEITRIQEFGLQPVWAHEIHASDQDAWIERILSQLGPVVYVSVDLDGLDPSIIPATGTPVPGGLTWYQLTSLLKAIGEQRRIVGCDVCELAPIPGQHAADFAAALLVYKMIGYFVAQVKE